MFKKVLSVVLVLGMVLALCSCGADTSEGAKKNGYDHKDLENMVTFVETTGEKYCTDIEEKAEILIGDLGKTFDSYTNNKAKTTRTSSGIK